MHAKVGLIPEIKSDAVMHKWEYCVVDIAYYSEGTGGGRQELLYLTLPGQQRTSVTNAAGSIGLLNQLGSEGWELVDVEPGLMYLKRPVSSIGTGAR